MTTLAPSVPGLVQRLGAALSGERRAPETAADHVRTLFEQTSVTLVGNIAGLCIVATMYGPLAPPVLLWSWVAWMLALIGLRGWFYLNFPRDERAPLAQLLRWRRHWNALALTAASGWGAAVWLFYDLGGQFHFVALVVIVYTYMVAGVQILSTQPRIYFGFVSLGMMPMIVRIALDAGEPYHLQLAGILVLVYTITLLMSMVYRRAFESTIRLKVRTEQLAAQLQREKSAADEARHAAEVANRAKTQFFAAASHDLRQPLHALGLFAEALRHRSHDDGVVHLVNSINSSVDALEGLFSELLDITRIDSGGVDVRPEPFAVGDLFGRLRLHFEPTAFEKGLALRFRGGQHQALADPVLVDRILRNLVSNAIRYTHDGTVLVSCRRRGGDLLLQVWDSGIGIDPSEQELVFEEFYQVPDGTRPAAHQRKGLGLGLAIVRRLASLSGLPLALRSQRGRGTVFTLTVPVGRAPRPGVAATSDALAAGVTLAGRRIVVVEDEVAVRMGLEVVLESWGAQVQSFASVGGCEAWLSTLAPGTPAPALLIVDYRLETGRTGVEAIGLLRRHFGTPVPAIVATGSAMTGPELDAQHHDFHLLIKPVVPNKLRAMIAFKLALRPTLAG